MSSYPDIEHEWRVPFEALRTVVAATFESCGMRPRDAGLLADSLAVADLRGIHSHGVLRVPEYVDKLTRTPAAMVAEDVAALRRAGFDDRAILDINQITGFFAWCNRTVDGLGVELEGYWPEREHPRP